MSEAIAAEQHDVLIVGAGFAGLRLLDLMRRQGRRARVLEAGDGVGGTWYWNRYPGARCDVESMQYSYQFDPALEAEWDWSERYAAQPEILAYAEAVAERLDLTRDIRFGTRVRSAVWDGALWRLESEDGAAFEAPICIMATGCLSAPNVPDLPGLKDFSGPVHHTGDWPHEGVDFSGQRVGVIGTGSSGIQSIPRIARQAASLTVFQRTANFAVPAWNRPLSEAERASVRAEYAALRARQKRSPNAIDRPGPVGSAARTSAEARQAEFEARWEAGGLPFLSAFDDLLLDPQANAWAADFVRARIREIVQDPATAELLCPTDLIGCKRLCVEIGYFETFNLPHVRLVDLRPGDGGRGGIETVTPGGLRAAGETFELDALVLATGFDAMTGALLRIDVRGEDGRSLRQDWAEGPASYLGLMVAGYPNLFTVTGPQSPSVLTNMIVSIEQHCEWIADAVAALEARGASRMAAEDSAQAAWTEANAAMAEGSMREACGSWYRGANIPGKSAVYMPYVGGFPAYTEALEGITARGYEGFSFA
ncbi:MAG: NAD(P)/FAD-dependent oxidoreductase [Pseudomonadota bacterium]